MSNEAAYERYLKTLETHLQTAEEEMVAARERALALRQTIEGLRSLLGKPQEAVAEYRRVASPKADLLVELVDRQPDRIWSATDLTAELRTHKLFSGVPNPLTSVQGLATRAVRMNRIRRVGAGRYRSMRGDA